jgi:hypothetical protein
MRQPIFESRTTTDSHKVVGGTTGIELERPDPASGGFERGSERLGGSTVLVLLDRRPGGAEKDLLVGVALSGSLDLEVRRGGERKFLFWTPAGEGGGGLLSTISTVTIGVEKNVCNAGGD